MSNFLKPVIPALHKKGLVTHFGCDVAPFYRCDETAPEGAAVVKSSTDPANAVVVATPGSCPKGTVIGLLAQKVYDPSAMGELAGYQFLNNTQERVGEVPVGVVMGYNAFVLTNNYVGAVAPGDKCYPAASGKLSASGTGSDVAIGEWEGTGTNGDTMVRLRCILPTQD
jgi:hypothetical protein